MLRAETEEVQENISEILVDAQFIYIFFENI